MNPHNPATLFFQFFSFASVLCQQVMIRQNSVLKGFFVSPYVRLSSEPKSADSPEAFYQSLSRLVKLVLLLNARHFYRNIEIIKLYDHAETVSFKSKEGLLLC